jgi:hypothetical protein
MIKIYSIISFLMIFIATSNAQTAAIEINRVTAKNVEIIAAPEEPNYTLMARRDAKKYFSTKKQFWTGLVCGFIPVVGWVSAPIIGASVKLKDQQMWNPGNNNNHLRESNTTYANAYRRYCIKKRAKNFSIGFGIGLATIAGYYFATQNEYKK